MSFLPRWLQRETENVYSAKRCQVLVDCSRFSQPPADSIGLRVLPWDRLRQLPGAVISLLLLCSTIGCGGTYDRSRIQLGWDTPSGQRVLSTPMPICVVVVDQRPAAPSEVGLAAGESGLKEYAAQDVALATKAAIEQTLGSQGFHVVQSPQTEGWTCRVTLQRFWVEWPMGFHVPVIADVRFDVVLLRADGTEVHRANCYGTASRTAGGGGLVSVRMRQDLLRGALNDALRRFEAEMQVAATRVDQWREPTHASEVKRSPVLPYEPVATIGRRYAVLIGIARYKSAGERLEALQYADKDARAFRDFLVSPAGGSFAPSDVQLLTNEQATTTEVRRALFSFLKSAIKEDLVVIFFSGHGAVDPDRPDNLYLLTYDTDPADIAATAFPMDDVRKALEKTIEAQRIVVLADACHSGGVASDLRTKGVQLDASNEAMSEYWSQLSRTGPGRVIFTSSQRGEVSQESGRWGDGHGVFTWALLEGLRGSADYDSNGIVTLGEALRFTDEKVRRETKSAQHPTVAGDQYDPNLPMGVVR